MYALFVISLAVAGELKNNDSCLENFYHSHEVAG